MSNQGGPFCKPELQEVQGGSLLMLPASQMFAAAYF